MADISRSNPNVLYELGIAQGMGKRTIIVTDDYSNVPSDLSHMHIIRFTDSPEVLRSLRKSIHNTLTDIGREKRWGDASVNQSSQIEEKEREDVARKEIEKAIQHRKSDNLQEAIAFLKNSLSILG